MYSTYRNPGIKIHDRNVIENTIMQMNIDGFVWDLRMVYLQCVSNGECSLAYTYSGPFSGKRSYYILGSRKVSARENVNTIVSFWNLTGSPTALLPRRLPNFRAIGKFYRNVIENTTLSYRWTSMASCETCVWWVYLQCVSNGGCSHAYYILDLFPVRNLTVLGSRKVPSRENVNTIASLWNLTGSSTALLPRRLPKFHSNWKILRKILR